MGCSPSLPHRQDEQGPVRVLQAKPSRSSFMGGFTSKSLEAAIGHYGGRESFMSKTMWEVRVSMFAGGTDHSVSYSPFNSSLQANAVVICPKEMEFLDFVDAISCYEALTGNLLCVWIDFMVLSVSEYSVAVESMRYEMIATMLRMTSSLLVVVPSWRYLQEFLGIWGCCAIATSSIFETVVNFAFCDVALDDCVYFLRSQPTLVYEQLNSLKFEEIPAVSPEEREIVLILMLEVFSTLRMANVRLNATIASAFDRLLEKFKSDSSGDSAVTSFEDIRTVNKNSAGNGAISSLYSTLRVLRRRCGVNGEGTLAASEVVASSLELISRPFDAEMLCRRTAAAAVCYSNADCEAISRIWAHAARLAEASCRFADAEVSLRNALNLCGSSDTLVSGVARLCSLQQKHVESIELLEQQLGNSQSSLSSLVIQQLVADYVAVGRYGDAELLINELKGRLNESDATWLDLRRVLAVVLTKLGRYEQAEEVFDSVRKDDEAHPPSVASVESLLNFAALLRLRFRLPEAKSVLEKALVHSHLIENYHEEDILDAIKALSL